jgi:hypothetical protein
MNIDCTTIFVALLGSGGVITIIINSVIRKHDKKLESKNEHENYIDLELEKAAKQDIEIIKTLAIINENGKAHKQENMLLFKGVLGLMDAMQTGHCNGNISSIQKEMKGYLYENGIK